MRRITLFMIAYCLLGAARPDPVKAQLLKSLTNNLKQSLHDRANGKASRTTNHLLDKVDSVTKFGGTHSGSGVTGGSVDTSGFTRVLGAFANTAQENPNDTNRADLVMKSLGRLAGGIGVSAQDSAAAIKAFMTAGGGSGYYFESMITITSKYGNSKDTSLMWLTNSGEGRSEMRIPLPGVQTPKMIVIGHMTQPKYSIILDDQTKTYTLHVIDTALINSGSGNFHVTRVGTETVSGYSCIHSHLVNSIGTGVFKTTNTFDIWTSTAVPGYPLFSKMLTLEGSQGGIFSALARAGANGMLVKMTVEGGSAGYSMTEVLIQAQAKSCSSSLFQIPSGYTNSETILTKP